MKRHDLIYVSPSSWRFLVETRADLAAVPLIAFWADKGWPMIGRRSLPDEAQGVALGLPLPPSAGKWRLSFVTQIEDIVAVAPPPGLSFARLSAPPAWWPTFDALDELALRHAVEIGVFGSLAWQALTGLDYLTERSDLDLLLHVNRHTDLPGLVADLAGIEAMAPMRLDGELIREDGAAVNWREYHAGGREILVKTLDGVAMLDTSRFAFGEVRS